MLPSRKGSALLALAGCLLTLAGAASALPAASSLRVRRALAQAVMVNPVCTNATFM